MTLLLFIALCPIVNLLDKLNGIVFVFRDIVER